MSLPKFHILDSTITAQRDGQTFDLLLNGQLISHHQAKAGAVAELVARLVCLPRYKLEVKPTQGTK